MTTRERADLRDRTLAFGVTKLSAGVSTAPGGYGQSDDATPQFSIHDERSLAEVAEAVRTSGLEPVGETTHLLGWRAIQLAGRSPPSQLHVGRRRHGLWRSS